MLVSSVVVVGKWPLKCCSGYLVSSDEVISFKKSTKVYKTTAVQ
jgi:hypothetical protein